MGLSARPPGYNQGVHARLEAVSLRAQLVDSRMGGRVIHEIREKYKLEDIRCVRLVLSKRQQLAVDAIHSGEFSDKSFNALNISLAHFR